MKLTLEHLAPYLPYELKGALTEDKSDDFSSEDWVQDLYEFKKGSIWQMCGYADGELNIPLGEGEFNGFLWRNKLTYVCFHRGIKPILRPLSDLRKEIEHNGENFVPDLWFNDKSYTMFFEEDFLRGITRKNSSYSIAQCSYNVITKLLEWHFDIFGLIEKGLAIDKNTLS